MDQSILNGSYHQLISSETWEKIYPQTDLKNLSNFLAKLPKENEATTCGFIISALASRDITCLSFKDPKANLWTPLHIACLRANFVAVKAILGALSTLYEKIQLINKKDMNGWTALHHSCLASKEIFDFLRENGGNLQARTHRDFTVEDLEKAIGRTPDRLTIDRVSLDLPEIHAKVSELTSDQLQKILGLQRYTDSNIYPPAAWIQLWRPKGEPLDPEPLLGFQAYQKWRANPPSLVICRCGLLTGAHILELRAGQTIKKGEGITTYAGLIDLACYQPSGFKDVFDPLIIAKQEYLLQSINAQHIGNAGRMANCGFPNAMMQAFDEGIGKKHVLIALRDISEGKSIIWNYGISATALKFGVYGTLNFEEMRQLFSVGFDKLIDQLSSLWEKTNEELNSSLALPKNLLEFKVLAHQFLYPLHTPAAILDLHYRNIVSCHQWEKLLRVVPNWFSSLHVSMGQLIFVQRSFMARIEEADHIFKTAAKNKRFLSLESTVKEWVLGAIEKRTIMEIIKGLTVLKGLFKNPTKELTIENAFENMELVLKNYNWLEDETGPLSLESRRQDILNIYKNKLIPEEFIKDLPEQINTMTPGSEWVEILKWVQEQLKAPKKKKKK